MIKEALQYLVSLAENKTYEINGEMYSDHGLAHIEKVIDRPSRIEVNGLDSIVKLINKELAVIKETPIFVRVASHRQVEVFTTFDATFTRNNLYRAVCDAPEFRAGWRDHENAIIELRSEFIQGEGTDYLLDLLSRMTTDNGVTTEDNGVSQKVEARTGISLKQVVNVKPRVALAPFRTFSEVPQPVSEFLLRLDEDGRVGLFEADGGMWKMEAKKNVSDFFTEALAKEIKDGKVVVMM